MVIRNLRMEGYTESLGFFFITTGAVQILSLATKNNNKVGELPPLPPFMLLKNYYSSLKVRGHLQTILEKITSL